MTAQSSLAPRDQAVAPTRSSSRWQRGLALLVLLGVAGLIVAHFLDRTPPAPPRPAATVAVAQPIARDVTLWDDYVGRFAPSQTVELRPRVSGQIVALNFRDGDIVQQGQILFTIDQRPFLAAQAEARADVAAAQATLDLARSDLARATHLTGDDAVSASETDQLRSRVHAGQANVDAANARLTQRSLDVEWSQVRAPITGRVSDRRADIGNLVSGGQANTGTLLTTINALDPIYFSFDASEALYLKAQRDRQRGQAATKVQIRLQDEPDYKWNGTLDFTDNGLNLGSGTIRGRATIANPQGFLTPGMFGNMRLASGGTVHALLVPDAAVQTDQTRKSVLVVGPDNIVTDRQVVLGPVVQGLRVIRAGLAPTDRVVIEGMQGAAPGDKVAPHDAGIAPDTADTDAGTDDNTPIAAQATFAQ